MVICSAEQSHEWVGQLPHPDPSGSSFLQSSCHGEGDGWGDHRQRSRWDTLFVLSEATFVLSEATFFVYP